jgi:hypothetical protein
VGLPRRFSAEGLLAMENEERVMIITGIISFQAQSVDKRLKDVL